ncbi:MAG: DUF3842 family protein [Firmicutes bacterium]|nr:DUF3842 family protein [Bacillota bacterium]
MNKNVLIIDGQGGQLGRQMVEAVRRLIPDAQITAVGTNSIATSAMLKAGADQGATGENAVVVCTRNADIIVGPVGIVIADSLLGEITPRMAVAVGQSPAKKILMPVNKCNNIIIGVDGKTTSELIEDAIAKIRAISEGCER